MIRTADAEWVVRDSVSRSTADDGLITASGTAVRFVVGLLGTVVVARALGPETYGVAVLVTLIAGLAELVRVSGAAASLVRAPTVDGPVASRVHRATVLLGVGAAVVVACSSRWIATLSEVAGPLEIACLGFVFVPAGLGAVPSALSARNGRFRALAIAEAGSVLVATGLAVLSAVAGLGVWALVVQAVAAMSAQCLVVRLLVPWRPGPRAAWREVRGHFRFGLNLLAVQVLNALSRGVDKLVVSVVCGPAAAGVYAQASLLQVIALEQVTAPVQRVVVPLLSRARQDTERLRRSTRDTVTTTALVLWPLFAVLAVLAHPLVEVLFSRAWLGAAPILQVLAVGGAAQTVSYVTTWLFSVLGFVGRQTVWTVVARPVFVLVCIAASPGGVLGVAAAYSAVSVVLVVPQLLLAVHGSAVRVRDVVGGLWQPATVAVFTAMAVATVLAVRPLGSVVAVALGGGVAVVTWMLCLFALPTPRRWLLAIIASREQ